MKNVTDRLKDTNAALLNWVRLIECKIDSGPITTTERMIAYNARRIAGENAAALAKAEGRE